MKNAAQLLRLGLLITIFTSLPLTTNAQLVPSFGSDRVGTAGFQVLKLTFDPRAAAMGEAVVANAFGPEGMLWNPALAIQNGRAGLSLTQANYYTDIQLVAAHAVIPLGSGKALGMSIQNLDSGPMDVTTEFQPFGTGETFGYTSLAAGLTWSQSLTNLFSYGLTARYVRDATAGLYTANTFVDLGIYYRVGDTGAQMGVAIRNFGTDTAMSGEIERPIIGGSGTTTETDFADIAPPTLFLMGLTYTRALGADGSLQTSLQLSNPNDYAENWNLGAEYRWRNTLLLRAGYRLGKEEFTVPSVGVGVHTPAGPLAVQFDLGTTVHAHLGTIHRFGITLTSLSR